MKLYNFDPPYGDDILQRKLPSIYLCIQEGCGEEVGRKPRKYCDRCLTKDGREEVERERQAFKT